MALKPKTPNTSSPIMDRYPKTWVLTVAQEFFWVFKPKKPRQKGRGSFDHPIPILRLRLFENDGVLTNKKKGLSK